MEKWHRCSELDNPGRTRISIHRYSLRTSQRSIERTLGDTALREAVTKLLQDCGKHSRSFHIVREGKPTVEAPLPIHLSLSHTKGIVCAVSSLSPIGIDCEHLRTFSPKVIARFTSADEIHSLGETNPELLTKLWCAKESVSKALGRGLSLDLRSIHLTKFLDYSRQKINKEMFHAALEGRDEEFIIKFAKINTAIVALAELPPAISS